ncbi:hypothetical protein Tco_0897402 [Tanacetum coccineum]
MDDPNITMEEYIRLEKEKAHRHGKVYNWETAKYGKIWYDEDVHDLRSVETEFPAIVFNDTLTSEVTLSCEPTVSPLNDNKIDFRISYDESDNEDYTVVQNTVQNLGVPNVGNHNGVIVVPGIANQNGNGSVVAERAEGNANGNNGNQIRLYFDGDLQQASTSGTQTDKALVYDSDGSAEVQLHDNCYNDEIFNMFTQEEQYTELLEPIPEPHQVPQNDSNVIYDVSSVE